MTSPVDLCNSALDQIVARTSITGIDPPSPQNNVAAQVAARTYQRQVDAIFRAAHWNCARKQGNLTLLKAAHGTPENPDGSLPTPPIPWRYEYGYPNDCLKVRFVIPAPLPISSGAPLMTNVGVSFQPLVNTALPFVPAIDTDAQGNQIRVILTNARSAQAVYTARIDNIDLWDPALQDAVIGALAAWFCSPINGDDGKKKLAIAIASGLLTNARIADGNEGITTTDHIPDWMSIRESGSSFWGFNLGDGFCAGWDAWGAPDGVSY